MDLRLDAPKQKTLILAMAKAKDSLPTEDALPEELEDSSPTPKKKKAAPFSGNLVVRKGEAQPSGDRPAEPRETKLPKAAGNTVSLTLRIDPGWYRHLILYAGDHRMTHQEVMYEALREYLQARDPDGRYKRLRTE
jgi:hypothetical protein